MSTMQTLTIGSLAYLDSFAGLVPCKVTAITGRSGFASSAQSVTLLLTANRGAYRKGESIETNGLHAVPRKAVHGKYGDRIRVYQVECTEVK